MSKIVLQQVIKKCSSTLLSNQQIQLNLCLLAHYLNSKENTVFIQQNHSKYNLSDFREQITDQQKEYVDKEIERVEEVISRKLVQMGKLENRIGDLCDQIEKVKKVIEDQQNCIIQKENSFLKMIKNEQQSVSKLQIIFKDQTKKISLQMRKLSEKKDETLSIGLLSKALQTQKEFYNEQKWSNKFSFNGQTLSKIQGSLWYQFAFFSQIPLEEEFSFKIKVVKSLQKQILIGVMDYQKQKQYKSSWNSNHAICYYAKNGYKYPCCRNEGNGVNQGQTVEVRIDRRESIIKWIVNNEQRAIYTHEILGDKSRKLMPYVEMRQAGDIIEWMG